MSVLNADSLDLSVARPALTLVLGEARSGKTHWALKQAAGAHGIPVVIAPSPLEADRFSRAVIGMGNGSSAVVTSTFPLLTAELMRPSEGVSKRNLNESLQRMVLADLVKQTIGANDYLGKMLSAPGFVAALQRTIHEWKLAGATADRFEAAMQDGALRVPDNLFRRKLSDLIRILRAYEQFLADNHLSDGIDYLRAATAQLTSGRAHIPYHANLIVFDGFHRFNSAQVELLRALAATGSGHGSAKCRIAVTLSYDDARPLLFAAASRLLHRLRSIFVMEEITLPESEAADSALNRLNRRLYSRAVSVSVPVPVPVSVSVSVPVPVPVSVPVPVPVSVSVRVPVSVSVPVSVPVSVSVPVPVSGTESGTGTVQILSAPNSYMETEMVAREFLRIRNASHYAWSDFGIVVRNAADYSQTASSVFERFQIPLSIVTAEKLSQNPVIACLLNLLRVYRFGWKRPDVVAFLKSSCASADRAGADSVFMAAKRFAIREGKESFLNNAELLCAGCPDMHRLITMMAALEPGVCEAGLTVGVRSQRLMDLVHALALSPAIGESDPQRGAADAAAWRSAAAQLTNLSTLERLRVTGPTSFAAFHEQVVAAWSAAGYQVPDKPESVHLVEPHNTREYRFRAAAVMGLTERVFPRRISEDPFLRDDERRAIAEVAGLNLEPHTNRADEERFLFYLAVTSASEHLIVSYPRAGLEKDMLRSFYLDEAEAAGADLITKKHTTLNDIAPRMDIASQPREQSLTALACLFDPVDQVASHISLTTVADDSSRTAAALQLEQDLRSTEDSRAVRAALHSRSLPNLPELTAMDLRSEFLSPGSVISIAELNAFARCPFHFMMRFRLGIEQDVREAYTALKVSIVRQTLNRYYAANRSDAVPSAARIYNELREIATEICSAAIPDAPPEKRQMLKCAVEAALQGVAVREYECGSRFEMTPAAFDLSFGFADSENISGSSYTGGAVATQSTSRPLVLMSDEDDIEVLLAGVIDRVDIDKEGKALILNFTADRGTDYGRMVRGEVIDLPLYMLAAERLFNHTAAVGCIDSFKERGRRRLVRTQHVASARFEPIAPLDDQADVRAITREQYAQLVQTTILSTVRIVRRMEHSEVTAIPGEYCRTCAYGPVCRTSITREA